MPLEKTPIQGYCAPGYEPVRETFAQLFATAGEQGAAVAVFKRGELLLNLWGGTRDKAQTQPWEAQTQVNGFSANKAMAAICALQLVESGALNLEQKVAHYWPAFAAAGKGDIRVRDILCHRSGVSAFHEPVPDAAIYDWDAITARIEAEKPWWTPGSEQGYSPIIYGWVVGELVRRVSGAATFNDYFQAQVARPLGLDDYHFGVPTELQPQLAAVGPLKQLQAGAGDLGRMMKADPGGLVNKAFTNPMSLMLGINSPPWRSAQIPAANGHASARALATIYGALAAGGTMQDTQLLGPTTLPLCWQEQSRSAQDRVLGVPLRFSLGFMLTGEREDCRFGRGARGFGHPGAGGCLGFADPDHGIGFGYVTNRLGQSLLIDERARALVDTLYRVETE